MFSDIIEQTYEKPTRVLNYAVGMADTRMRSIDMQSISRTPSVYQIRHVASGRVYVGSAVNPQQRCRAHLSDLRLGRHSSIHLQRAWDKYGESAFVFEVIEPVLFVEDLLTREQYWLDCLRAADDRYGYNISPTAGSPLGVKHSEEDNAAQSDRLRAHYAKPDAQARRTEHNRKLAADPDVQARRVAAIRAYWNTPEARARRAEQSRALWADPEYRARLSAARRAYLAANPDAVAKMGEEARVRCADPAVRAKMSERNRKRYEDPAERKKESERMTKRYEDPAEREKQRARWDDPEYRERVLATRKQNRKNKRGKE